MPTKANNERNRLNFLYMNNITTTYSRYCDNGNTFSEKEESRTAGANTVLSNSGEHENEQRTTLSEITVD